MMLLTIKRALGISAMSLAVASGGAVTWAPHAVADTDCGTSSHGASVSAGPDTSCGYALDAAERPVSNFSEVDVTDGQTGKSSAITPASFARDDELIYQLCNGGGVVISHPNAPGKGIIVCKNGMQFDVH